MVTPSEIEGCTSRNLVCAILANFIFLFDSQIKVKLSIHESTQTTEFEASYKLHTPTFVIHCLIFLTMLKTHQEILFYSV